MARLSVIQLCSVPDVEQNLNAIHRQLTRLTQSYQDNHHLVLLPECCLYFGGEEHDQLTLAKKYQHNAYLAEKLAALAAEFSLFLVAGTIPVLKPNSTAEKFSNASCVFTPDGVQVAQYDKIHLFDVCVADKAKNYHESKYTCAGNKVVTTDLLFANLGLSVCYDLRFPALFSKLREQGADVITVPSAFTKVTGQAHWQALLQARAIENQVYIVAAGQFGEHPNGRETWGHSMIVSPWGEILAIKPTGEGFASAEFSTSMLTKIRENMPVFAHNKFTTELIPYE